MATAVKSSMPYTEVEMKTFTMDDAEVQVNVGDVFQVRVETNPGSTGFDWYLAEMSRALLLNSDFEKEPARVIGKPVHKTFTFKALKQGNGLIELNLLGPGAFGNVTESHSWPFHVTK